MDSGTVDTYVLQCGRVYGVQYSKWSVPEQDLHQYSTWSFAHSARYLRARVPGWVLEFRTMNDPRGSRSRTDMASSLGVHTVLYCTVLYCTVLIWLPGRTYCHVLVIIVGAILVNI